MKLFSPVSLGELQLRNRIVMAPLTRRRADPDGVPSPSAALYYAQRAGAGLLVSEGVCISAEGVGDRRLPGIWNDAQIEGWKSVTAAVHAQGGLIVAQLWHTGRASHPLLQPGGADPVAPSAIAISKERELDGEMMPSALPRALSAHEIERIVGDYADGAANALRAGFDGVELHGANGYLIDQFLQDGSNRRADHYGGTFSNRTRFLRDVIEAVSAVVGQWRVGLRVSPSSTFQSMQDSRPRTLWQHVLGVVADYDLAYLHLVEPGISGAESHRGNADDIDSTWVRERYEGRLIAAGRYTGTTAETALMENRLDAVAFGRLFTSNPDLPERIRRGEFLNPPHRPTFYTADDLGYIDWPSIRAEELLADLEAGRISGDVSAGDDDRGLSVASVERWEMAWALSRYRSHLNA